MYPDVLMCVTYCTTLYICTLYMLYLLGCTPCVMDLYHEDMKRWLTLKTMTTEEREKWWREKSRHYTENNKMTSPLTPDSFKR